MHNGQEVGEVHPPDHKNPLDNIMFIDNRQQILSASTELTCYCSGSGQYGLPLVRFESFSRNCSNLHSVQLLLALQLLCRQNVGLPLSKTKVL